MITGILTNGVKTIIIELDRLARDLTIQEHIIQGLQHRGIALVSVAEPDPCSDDPTRKLMRQIMGAIAEYDKLIIVLKLRGASARGCAPEVAGAKARSPTERNQAKRNRSQRSRLLELPAAHSRQLPTRST